MRRIIISAIGITVTQFLKEFCLSKEEFFVYSIPISYFNIAFSCMFLFCVVKYVVKNEKVLKALRALIIAYNIVSAIVYTISLLKL